MAVNPPLMGAMPVPFQGEIFLLRRDNVIFEVDKIPSVRGGQVSAKGTVFVSNVRVVYVTYKPVDGFYAFDMPLLYIHEEKFNQPIFGANNITGKVYPVIPDGEHSALYSPHSFKIIFKEGGCGTFVPLFFNLLKFLRQFPPQTNESQSHISVQQSNSYVYNDPFPTASPPTDEIMRQAYVDPNDPTKIYLQQPYDPNQSQLRRRTYVSPRPEEGQL
ncbi:hypothetical protein GOP47_0001639 [Adiantum capillus-veneris]|uniref:Uncharacterized protein n=1 Tax=Adiantum capillus-veneris TaxID=13818 RepID=A0A9D4ZQ79_ADICA|nr:hypothetical protein GOP47_0001639 [Adiantum capillus-veneris]